MHMADALLSPAVGCTVWAASAATIAYCSRKVREELDDKKVPLMGVLGAFLFAAQMVNFTIPATGSSGHLGGGLLLTIMLGPYAAFLTIASVLTVQALFFADGGLLALGCNMFNLGVFPAFIAYPLIYKKIIGIQPTQGRIVVASLISAVTGLQMGAFAVVLETVSSEISSLPFSAFVALMQPIHFGIGIVEGLVTASVVSFVYHARPEILQSVLESKTFGDFPVRTVAVSFLAAALVTGGIVSWFASENPDGLEWSIRKITGKNKLEGDKGGLHGTLATLQNKIAVLPDYSFKSPETAQKTGGSPTAAATPPNIPTGINKGEPKKDGNKLGTGLSGVLGGIMTLAIAGIIGLVLRKQSQTS